MAVTETQNLPLRLQRPHMETCDSPCVLLLDLTSSALAGIDLLSFTTTPKFKGIKGLPPGVHFVFCSTTSDLSVRHGAWFEVPKDLNDLDAPQPIFIKRWNTGQEQLEAVTDIAEQLRWRANLGSIWKEGLAPYRQSASESSEETHGWTMLTDCVSSTLLSRILSSSEPENWSLTSAASATSDLEAIPGLSVDGHGTRPEKELHFLPVDLKRPWREGATGRERTEAARDHSWYLKEVIEKHCLEADEQHIIGEMQFCFLMVLTLNNYSCLEQWKRLLSLVLTCTTAVSEFSDFYVSFFHTLRLQLEHCHVAEGGLFDLADESGSLLKQLLHNFKLGLNDISGTGKSDVVDELDELENYLRGEHGWELDSNIVRKGVVELEDGEEVELEVTAYDHEDERGEYAPQVVDLTEEQMRELGITKEDVERLLSRKGLDGLSAQEDFVADSSDDEESPKEVQLGALEDEVQDLEDLDERY